MSTTQSPLTQPTSQRASLKAPLILLAFMFVATFVGLIWMGYRTRSPSPVFHQTKTGWQQLPPPAGFPEKLRVSAKGTVWVLTWSGTRLRYWDGYRWRSVKVTDTKSSSIDGNFALDGEQVWAPTGQG